METLQIVRIERNGNGIFRPSNRSICKYKLFKEYSRRHWKFPVPYAENLDLSKQCKEWFCAYATVQIMQQWLKDEEIQFLIKKGFKILLLEVSEFQEGSFQALYTKKSIINQEDITSIFTK